MNNSNQRIYLIISIISTILLIDGIDNSLETALLIIMSLPLLRFPASYIPLIWSSSWYSSFAVLPFINAYFYYSILFLIALLYNRKTYGIFASIEFKQYLLIALCLWYIACLPLSVSPDYNFVSKIIIQISLIVLVGCFRSFDAGYVRKSLLYISVASSLFFFLISTLFPIEFVISKDNKWGEYIHTGMTLYPGMHTNSAAQIIVLTTIILVCNAFRSSKQWLIVPISFNIYTLFYLGSRTSFFTLIFTIIVYILVFLRISTKNKIAFITSLFFSYGVILLLMPTHSLTSRIVTDSIIEDQGSGRFVTWMRLWNEIIPHYWLKGIGIGREGYTQLGFFFDADNMYIDLLCETGIVGFLLFLLIYICFIKHAFQLCKSIDDNIDFIAIMILAFMMLGIGESVFDAPLYWSTLLCIMYFLKAFYLAIPEEEEEKMTEARQLCYEENGKIIFIDAEETTL